MSAPSTPRISVRFWVAALAAALAVTSLLALAGAIARGDGAWWPLASLGIGGAIAVATRRAAVAADSAVEAPLEPPIRLMTGQHRTDSLPSEIDDEGVREAA